MKRLKLVGLYTINN